jgi:hypothetical protein
MALLRPVQHGRLGVRGFSRLPPVAYWNPPPTYEGSGIRQSHGILTSFWKPFSVARRNSSPPFPTSAFVIGAGVTRFPFIAFVLSFAMGRVCRFALLAYLASVFGRRFVSNMWSAHTLALVAAFLGVLVCVGLLAWLIFRKSEPHTPFGL